MFEDIVKKARSYLKYKVKELFRGASISDISTESI